MRLLMPFDDPQKLNDVQKLAVVAFLLDRNAAIVAGAALTPANAARVAIK